MAFSIWPNRWMRCGFKDADGSKGGILLLWDSRVWRGNKIEEGKYSITYSFVNIQGISAGPLLVCMLHTPGRKSWSVGGIGSNEGFV